MSDGELDKIREEYQIPRGVYDEIIALLRKSSTMSMTSGKVTETLYRAMDSSSECGEKISQSEFEKIIFDCSTAFESFCSMLNEILIKAAFDGVNLESGYGVVNLIHKLESQKNILQKKYTSQTRK